MGTQLVRSTDSIAANLVEGDGRRSDVDSVRFLIYSRASAREARHWIRVATDRGRVDASTGEDLIAELTEIAKMIQGIIKARRQSLVRETRAPYGSDDPFCPDDLTT